MDGIEISRIKREPYHLMKNTHSHEEYELYYLLSGKRRFFIHDTIYLLDKGSFVLLKGGVVHKTTNVGAETHERIIIYFNGEYLRRLFKDKYKTIAAVFDTPYIMPPSGTSSYLEGLMSRIETEHELGGEFSEMLTDGYMRELLVSLFRCGKTGEPPSIVSGDSAIEQAARFIVKNYNKNITLEDVSEFVHLSSGYFSKKFKNETGIGFKEYLGKIRIQKAMEMLAETDYSITDIAYKCGFNDSNYFGDAFAHVVHMSPSRYRKEKRGEDRDTK